MCDSTLSLNYYSHHKEYVDLPVKGIEVSPRSSSGHLYISQVKGGYNEGYTTGCCILDTAIIDEKEKIYAVYKDPNSLLADYINYRDIRIIIFNDSYFKNIELPTSAPEGFNITVKRLSTFEVEFNGVLLAEGGEASFKYLSGEWEYSEPYEVKWDEISKLADSSTISGLINNYSYILAETEDDYWIPDIYLPDVALNGQRFEFKRSAYWASTLHVNGYKIRPKLGERIIFTYLSGLWKVESKVRS
jgi:hypothetical protein